MKIRKRALADPAFNGPYAVSAIAVSFFVFAYSTRLGQISILIYYSLWFPLLLVAPRSVIGNWKDLRLPCAIAFWCIISVTWSDAPSVTLRGALQFASHILCAVIAARLVSFRSLSLGVVIGCFFVVLYSFGVGNYAVDVIDGSFTFVGAFESKNSLGFYSSVCVYFSIVTISSLRVSWRVRLFCLVTLAPSVIALVWCRSATSLASLVGSLTILLGLKFFTRFPPIARTVLLIGLATLSAGIALAGDVLGLLLRALGKDATLTGRTYLWSEGIDQIQDHPFLGYGYRAWWIEGRPKAEELWELFYIPQKSGFHFHNMYIETAVEIGVVGLFLFIAVIVVTFARYTRLFLTTRDFEVPALLGLLVMMIARSFVEVDFLTTYAPGSFLMFWMLCSSRELLRSRGLGRARPKRHPF